MPEKRNGNESPVPKKRGVVMDWIYAKGIPIEAQYLYRKGLGMMNAGKPEAALAYFKQSVVLAPRYAKAFFEMGNCLALMGQYDAAMVKYNRAIEVDPHFNVPSSLKTTGGRGTDEYSRHQTCCSTGCRN
jgi:tetratricopeptide (TPR) repeat protein